MIRSVSKMTWLVSALGLLFAGGCTAIIHDAVVESFPTYADTMRAAPTLAPNSGRMVIFYPRLPMAGFNPVPFGTGGAGIVELTVDAEKASVMDQTFVFIDVPAGQHAVAYSRGGLLAGTHRTDVNVKAGSTTFVRINAEQLEEGPGKIVTAAEAQGLLANVRHAYKEALPFNRQPTR